MSKVLDYSVIDWSEYFYYDESSPTCLRWKVSVKSIYDMTFAGMIAGTLSGNYARVQLDKQLYSVHLIIWQMLKGKIPDGCQIDHIDLNKRNNKINNLRPVSRSINCRNRPKRVDNKTGITGLHYRERNLAKGVYGYWIARYQDKNGNRKSKEFACHKYGYEQAREMATTFLENTDRTEHNYTERHGK